MDITRKSLPEQHYLYVDREASFTEPGAIAGAMQSGFGEVFGFTQGAGIQPLTMPSSIYVEMPSGDKMSFRAAVFVTPEDAAKAEGNVLAGVIPACDVLAATHTGAYATMHETHKAMWDHAEKEGLAKTMPAWEIYVDDPTTKPEAEVRTEIFHLIG